MEKHTYHADWIKEPKEADTYLMWDCGNRYEIIIVQYNDKPSRFVVEYMDSWSMPIMCKRDPVVKISCVSLHDAKLMGDKAAKECDVWLDKPHERSDLFG